MMPSRAIRATVLGQQVAVERVVARLGKQRLPPIAALRHMRWGTSGMTMRERRAMKRPYPDQEFVQYVSCHRNPENHQTPARAIRDQPRGPIPDRAAMMHRFTMMPSRAIRATVLSDVEDVETDV
jgi:hypothetical protein